jgi:hypothetical protein
MRDRQRRCEAMALAGACVGFLACLGLVVAAAPASAQERERTADERARAMEERRQEEKRNIRLVADFLDVRTELVRPMECTGRRYADFRIEGLGLTKVGVNREHRRVAYYYADNQGPGQEVAATHAVLRDACQAAAAFAQRLAPELTPAMRRGEEEFDGSPGSCRRATVTWYEQRGDVYTGKQVSASVLCDTLEVVVAELWLPPIHPNPEPTMSREQAVRIGQSMARTDYGRDAVLSNLKLFLSHRRGLYDGPVWSMDVDYDGRHYSQGIVIQAAPPMPPPPHEHERHPRGEDEPW